MLVTDEIGTNITSEKKKYENSSHGQSQMSPTSNHFCVHRVAYSYQVTSISDQ